MTLNTTTQPQNTILPNILNLTSQLMGITTEATAGGSNTQSNVTNNVNTGGGHFSHFSTVGANLFEGFGTFEESNNNPLSENNNNNNPLPPLPPSGFKGDLGGGFNPLSRENAGGLDLNVIALINAL